MYRTIIIKSIASLLLFICLTCLVKAQNREGCYLNTTAAYNGYTLITQSMSQKSHLINNCGEILHEWTSEHRSKTTNFLSEDGRLFKMAVSPKHTEVKLRGKGGIIEVLDWNSEVLWSHDFVTPTQTINHDFELLPNGNLLLIFAELIYGENSLELGRKGPRKTYATVIKEIEMIEKDEVNVVWEWKVTDHLIQDFDKNRPNYGVVEDHPEKININYELHRSNGMFIPIETDLFHVNAIDYNAELDQILLTVKHYGEIWVIDHSTTTTEAAGSLGGKSGKGGDLLYRYGNPAAYNAGSPAERLLFAPHNARWIEKGLPNEGHFMIYNNGKYRTDADSTDYSDILIVASPFQLNGNYNFNAQINQKEIPVLFQYAGQADNRFYSPFMSSVQPLANGNYLVNVAEMRTIFEVTPEKEIVWRFFIPVDKSVRIKKMRDVGAFKVQRYAPNIKAFEDKDLTPKGRLGEVNFDCQTYPAVHYFSRQ